jgi:hypothetical protein
MRWQDFVAGPAGAQRLASLQAAIAKMKSLDGSPPNSADYRRSWAYWANIHGYYGSQSPDGTVQQQIAWLNANGFSQYVPFYNGITNQTPPDATAQQIWATCQHSGQTQALNFFGWHRMYLYYYERVLRWAANDPNLRLPYWDYTDPANLALPSQFRASSSTLFDGKRSPSMNSGSATLNGNATDIDDLLPDPSYFDYESQIEEGVHGYVHCTVGPTCPVAHMGDVPVAGNDPVFYHHHANIDRMWACWQNLHPTPPGAWQDQQFSFVDETGTLQTKPVKDFLASAPLGYVYDNVTDCARTSLLAAAPAPTPTPAATAAPVPAPPPEERRNLGMAGATSAIRVDRPAVTVDLPVPPPTMRRAIADLGRPGNVQLVLRDVTAQSHPGTLLDVYIARKGDPASRQHVGTISWFGAFRHHGESSTVRKTLRYDVTDELRALGGEQAAEGVTVIVEASHGRMASPRAGVAAAAPAEDAARDFRPQANVRIGAIELRSVAMNP